MVLCILLLTSYVIHLFFHLLARTFALAGLRQKFLQQFMLFFECSHNLYNVDYANESYRFHGNH